MEKAMASHSSTLAWKIPWMEEPGRLQSMGSLRVRHDWATSLWLFTVMHWRRKWQPTPVFLPGESPGMGEPGGLPSMGSHRVRHDWSYLAAAAAAAFKWLPCSDSCVRYLPPGPNQLLPAETVFLTDLTIAISTDSDKANKARWLLTTL